MAITLANMPALLRPGLNKVFSDYPRLPAQFKEIFEMNTSEMAWEQDVEVKLLGMAQQRAEGQATAYEDMGQRYTTFYRHVAFSLGFVMTKFAIRDNKYKTEFGPNTKALKNSMLQAKEVYCASVLNNAADTTGTYIGGDGVALLSTAHPIDTGTFANTPAVPVQLSETALQDAIVAIRRFRDAAGLRANIQAKKLIIAPENMFVAHRILNSDRRVGTADNDANALKDMGMFAAGPIKNDYLTNSNAWFIITDCDNGLRFFQRDALETDSHVTFDNDNLMTKAVERYSAGWSNARGLFGSAP